MIVAVGRSCLVLEGYVSVRYLRTTAMTAVL